MPTGRADSSGDERLRFVGALAEAREIMDSLLRGKEYAKREAERWLKDYSDGEFHKPARFAPND